MLSTSKGWSVALKPFPHISAFLNDYVISQESKLACLAAGMRQCSLAPSDVAATPLEAKQE